MHIFGLWKETGIHGKMHWENIQALHRNAGRRTYNLFAVRQQLFHHVTHKQHYYNLTDCFLQHFGTLFNLNHHLLFVSPNPHLSVCCCLDKNTTSWHSYALRGTNECTAARPINSRTLWLALILKLLEIIFCFRLLFFCNKCKCFSN